jgi:hypothetical protein
MSTDQVVDVSTTPVDPRRRRVLMRTGIPIAAVALIVAVIFAIAYYAERANRSGVLLLSDDLLATLQERIGQEVSAYLDPAVRATRLARDMTAQTTIPDPLGALQSFVSSALKQNPADRCVLQRRRQGQLYHGSAWPKWRDEHQADPERARHAPRRVGQA